MQQYISKFKYSFVFVFFFFFYSQFVHGQYSLSEQLGVWQNSGSWVGSSIPDYTSNIFIDGTIISNETINPSTDIIITVRSSDTLIIYGDLNLEMKANKAPTLVIEEDAVVIIYGSLISENKVEIDVNGHLIVEGDLNINPGANTVLELGDSAKVYVLGDVVKCEDADCTDIGDEEDMDEDPVKQTYQDYKLSIQPEEPYLCNENDFDTLSVMSGADYYNWYYNGILIAGENSNRLIINEAGNYSVEFYIFDELRSSSVDATMGNFSMSVIVQDASCDEVNNGIIDLTVSGGVSPYTFLWSNGSTDEDLDSLGTGTYTVFIEDDEACVITDTFDIGAINDLAVTITGVFEQCYNPTGFVFNSLATGGESPYAYVWTNSLSQNSTTGSFSFNTLNESQEVTIDLMITDDNNCTATDTKTLEIIKLPDTGDIYD